VALRILDLIFKNSDPTTIDLTIDLLLIDDNSGVSIGIDHGESFYRLLEL